MIPQARSASFFAMTDYQSILSFWFGADAADSEVINRQSSRWWGKNETVDREIRERFAGLHARLIRGELDDWKADDRGRLAMIILADQFPRNMYRDTPKAFASDAQAVSLTLDGIEAGTDRRLRLVERVFFYMPLMHAESRALQDRAVALYRDLAGETEGELRKKFEYNLDFAERHRDIVQRYGRFPHRNRILGRESTAAEREFLKQPGSSF